MSDALERALCHADLARDPSEHAAIVAWLNVAAYYGPTTARDAIARYEQVLASVEEETIVGGSTSCLLAGALAMTGRFDDARRIGSRGTMILSELGQPARLSNARAYIADAELLAGDARGAERELEEAYSTFSRIGYQPGAVSAAWELASVLCAQARYDDAERWAAVGRDVLDASDVMTRVSGLATEARLAVHAGRAAEGHDLARRAVELAERTDALNVRAGAWLALAEALRLQDGNDEADGAVSTAVRIYEAKGNEVAARLARALSPAPAS
jgi:tetratricopeptide (TPR) repeat protein